MGVCLWNTASFLQVWLSDFGILQQEFGCKEFVVETILRQKKGVVEGANTNAERHGWAGYHHGSQSHWRLPEKPHRMHLKIVPVMILGHSYWSSYFLSCGLLPQTMTLQHLWTIFAMLNSLSGRQRRQKKKKKKQQRDLLVDTWDEAATPCETVQPTWPYIRQKGGDMMVITKDWNVRSHVHPSAWPLLSPADTSLVLFSSHHHYTPKHPSFISKHHCDQQSTSRWHVTPSKNLGKFPSRRTPHPS